ncbi:MAG: DUF4190 domain-containing protein [Proteobacteria bacterium]|nr:DUF4190 domain-containing protein [Pseudomonadota bacterium]
MKCGANIQPGQPGMQQQPAPPGWAPNVAPGYPPQQMGGYPQQQMGGYPPQPPMMPPVMYGNGQMQTRTSGMAIAGFVLSFLGMLSILGLIFSALGLAEVKKSNGTVTGGGLAIAGIAISSVWLLLFLAIMSGGIRMSHLF